MNRFIKLGLVIVWCLLIFFLSAEDSTRSNFRSQNLLSKGVGVYEKVSNHSVEQKEKVVEKWNYCIRKFAHFSVYFILGLLVFWCLSDYVESFPKSVVLCIFFCFSYAMTDEFHQLFTSGRTGKLFDVFIDTLGSITAVFICFLIRKFQKFRLEQK